MEETLDFCALDPKIDQLCRKWYFRAIDIADLLEDDETLLEVGLPRWMEQGELRRVQRELAETHGAILVQILKLRAFSGHSFADLLTCAMSLLISFSRKMKQLLPTFF